MHKELIEKHLNSILEHIGVSPEITISEKDGTYAAEINGDNLNFLIGYRGESLDALQYLLGHAVFKELGEWQQVSVDINNYKKEKLKKLDGMIKSSIDRARFHQNEYRLPPLNAYERKYVHTFVSDYPDIETESRGEGKDRRLFLIPK